MLEYESKAASKLHLYIPYRGANHIRGKVEYACIFTPPSPLGNYYLFICKHDNFSNNQTRNLNLRVNILRHPPTMVASLHLVINF